MAVAVDLRSTKVPKFAGEKQVRARPINKVDQRAAVLHQRWINITLTRIESPYVFRERAIHAKGSIELELGSSLDLQLRPSAHRIERSYASSRIKRIAVE